MDITTDQTDSGTLSSTIRSKESENLTLRDTKCDVVNSVVGTELLLQVERTKAVFALLCASNLSGNGRWNRVDRFFGVLLAALLAVEEAGSVARIEPHESDEKNDDLHDEIENRASVYTHFTGIARDLVTVAEYGERV
jgi:hypothetical protein